MDDVFDERAARRKAREYARRGLAGDARRIADVIRSDVPAGGTLLEIGGGVGEIQLDLLRDHVARAMNVELATTYETAARELIAERGLADRVERRVADFVTEAPAVPDADVVVMHRVVCCYPDAASLVGAAAAHARRYLVLTFPVERWWIPAGLRVANALLRLRGSRFRAYAHPTAVVVGSAERAGLRRARHERGLVWQLVSFGR